MLQEIKNILKVKAPSIVDAFQAGADEGSIAKLESLVSEKLPDDMKLLYRDSDGFSDEKYANLFYGFPFINLKKVMSIINSSEAISDDAQLKYADDGIDSSYTHSKKRVPIGDDSGTSFVCVDLDPADDGVYGQVILLDYEMGVALRLNDSISDMVREFEDDLKQDKYKLQEDALADGVHWLDPIKQVDPGNWFNSPRWQYVNEALK